MSTENGHVPTAPAHLSRTSRAFWRSIARTYELEDHHYVVLTLACEALDRATQARGILAKDGIVTADRFGQRVTHPAVAIERDARLSVARLVRALDLDVVPPGPIGRPAKAP